MSARRLVTAITTSYSVSLEKRPLLTEMATSGLIWCLGDLTTQLLEAHNKIDWKRTLNQGLYASLLWGPIAHEWYLLLDRMVRRWVPNDTQVGRRVMAKLGLEIVWLHPISLLTYFVVVGTMNGESLPSIQNQLQTDFFPTYLLEIGMWTPLDICNFAYVPVRHQLLVVNCACFIESIFLSFIKNNGIGGIGQTF